MVSPFQVGFDLVIEVIVMSKEEERAAGQFGDKETSTTLDPSLQSIIVDLLD